MLHKTKGIVLRAVKYGETSLVVTVFTELFGLQSYMVNGVRMISKKELQRALIFRQVLFLILLFTIINLKTCNALKNLNGRIYTTIFILIFLKMR